MIILLTILICLVSLEIFLRIFRSNLPLTPGTYVSHPTRRYILRPNFLGKTYNCPYKINSLGLRDYEYSVFKDKGTFRILCVGDSFTFGIGLELPDTYPKQLEKLLQARYPDKKIEVINCGVPSYNTIYEYLFLKEGGLKYNPDLVIIGYAFNDSVFNHPITPSKYKFLNIFKDILRKLYAYEFIIDKIYRIDYVFKGYTSTDPKFRIESLKYAFSDTYIGWQKNKEAFKLLAELSRINSIPIVYMIFPKFESLEKDYPYVFFHQKVKEALNNKPYVLDLLPYFHGKKTEDLWVNRYDSHSNRETNAIISKVILDFCVSKNLIERNQSFKKFN